MAESTRPEEKCETTTPQTFGRYQLLTCVGRGGMAEVYKARINAAAGTEKVVCIKRILPHLSQNTDFTSLFIREAKITLSLSHGNITHVFDFGEVEKTYYLAMEYVHGQNLARVLERLKEVNQRLGIDVALFVAAEICRGLEYAHSQTDGSGQPAAVVHRDVSPHNVLISYHGEVKLTDFGIALAAAKMGSAEQVVRGKPCYIAPEQVDGGPGDARTDVFALGVSLYEMLTGIRPFEASTDTETLKRVRNEAAVPPSQQNSDVDEALDEVVLRALAKDPAERFQRAGDLQIELTKALHRRSETFTAGRLSELMRELFAWELHNEQSQGDPSEGGHRDRLLFQLSRAGVQVGNGNATTDELLQMHTVALDSGGVDPTDDDSENKRNLLMWVGGLVVLLGVVFGTWALSGISGQSSGFSDAQPPQLRVIPPDPTEHLLPTSLREETPEDPEQQDAETATSPDTPLQKNEGATSDKTVAVRRTARARVFGYLNINSWPWSFVYLDGKRMRGNTPLYQIKVRAGRHRLEFVNPELSLSKSVAVVVEAGKVRTVAVKLQPSSGTEDGSARGQAL